MPPTTFGIITFIFGMLLPLSIGMNPYLLLFVFTDNKMCWLRGLDVMACYLSLWGSEKAS